MTSSFEPFVLTYRGPHGIPVRQVCLTLDEADAAFHQLYTQMGESHPYSVDGVAERECPSWRHLASSTWHSGEADWLAERVEFYLSVGDLLAIATAAGMLMRHALAGEKEGAAHLEWVRSLSSSQALQLEDLALARLWTCDGDDTLKDLLMARDEACSIYQLLHFLDGEFEPDSGGPRGQRLGAALAGWDRLMEPLILHRAEEFAEELSDGEISSEMAQLASAAREAGDRWWGDIAFRASAKVYPDPVPRSEGWL